MNNIEEKSDIPIMKIILITFISIMLVTSLLISVIVFTNWFSYADRGLTEIVTELNKDIYALLNSHGQNYSFDRADEDILKDQLTRLVNNEDTMALLVDRESGELIANSLDMDNYLIFQDGTEKPIMITNMGYPALSKAYYSYLESDDTLFKLKNIENKLYIKVTDFKTEDIDLLIISAVKESRLTGTILKNVNYIIFLVGLAIITSLAAYLVIGKRLLKPVTYLLDMTEKFSSGDFSQRVSVVRNDEIGMISKAFNNMADTIYELVNNLEDKVRERTKELEKASEIMKDNRNDIKLILDSTGEGIYGMDTEGNCTFCNSSSMEILGYDHEENLIGKNMHYQIHHTKRDGTQMNHDECRILKAVKGGYKFYADDEIFWKRDGTFFDVEYRVYPQIKDGKVLGGVVTFNDITEAKKVREQIDFYSFRDPVTGLYNRQFFENEIKKIDQDKNLPISIIYGDLNGLKLINDILGHEKGDELLKKSSEVLTRVCRDDDVVARIGGDEFIIILKNTGPNDAKKIIERIKSEIVHEKIAGIKGSISLGMDSKMSPDKDMDTVIKNAEEEMYRVKTLEGKKVHSGMLNDIMEFLFEKSPREKLHSKNVSRVSGYIAEEMDLVETDIRRVRDIGYYHDIGKIVLDKSILNKADKLSPEEKEDMERHTMIGYRILNLFNETMDIAEVVLAHHERWDGQGYPKGLKGKEIPLYSRIISVAEGYDAMTNRVGGSNISHEKALEDIKSQSGIMYDPDVVDSFLRLSIKK